MSLWEIILIGVALSMDAVAVSVTNGLVYPGTPRGKTAAMPALFGVFQAGMPLLGYFAGGLLSGVITRFAGPVCCAILCLIGGKMIWDGFKSRGARQDQPGCACASVTWRLLFAQALATSLDAFAVGVGFHAKQTPILEAALVIGAVTFLLCLAAIPLGRRMRCFAAGKPALLGGVILIAIGVKALF